MCGGTTTGNRPKWWAAILLALVLGLLHLGGHFILDQFQFRPIRPDDLISPRAVALFINILLTLSFVIVLVPVLLLLSMHSGHRLFAILLIWPLSGSLIICLILLFNVSEPLAYGEEMRSEFVSMVKSPDPDKWFFLAGITLQSCLCWLGLVLVHRLPRAARVESHQIEDP